MSVNLGSVDLSSLAVGQSDILDWSGAGLPSAAPGAPVAHLQLFNESGSALDITLTASGRTFHLPAGGWLQNGLALAPNDRGLSLKVTSIIPNAEVSALSAVYYGPGEPVPQIVLGNSPIAGSVVATPMNLYYNVQDTAYGAKGNGVTDDTLAMQAAINAAEATGLGGVIFFPPGVYIQTAPLIISADNIMLLGCGRASTLQPGNVFTGINAGMVFFGGGGAGIHHCGVQNLRFYGGSTNTLANLATDAMQFNSPCSDMMFDNVEIEYVNGWALQLIAGNAGDIGYAQLTNVVAKKCAQGFHFKSTNPGANFGGGVSMTNCVADDCKAGDSYFFEDVTDNVMTNCQGYANNNLGSSLHIKGCAFTYFSTLDLGGGGAQTTPCVLIEKSATKHPDHIVLHDVLIQKGLPGLSITGATNLRVTDCDIFFNQTDGIKIFNDASTGSIIIEGCHFNVNNQNSAATTYDLNNVNTNGFLIVRNNHFSTSVGGGAHQVAASLASPDFWGGLDCQANVFSGGAPALAPAIIRKTIVRNNAGYNPVGLTTAPGVPASGTPFVSDRSFDCMVVIATLGTLTAVAIGGNVIPGAPAVGSQYRVPANQSITLTYAGAAPTWQWFGD